MYLRPALQNLEDGNENEDLNENGDEVKNCLEDGDKDYYQFKESQGCVSETCECAVAVRHKTENKEHVLEMREGEVRDLSCILSHDYNAHGDGKIITMQGD